MTGTPQVLIRRSNVQGKAPTTGQLSAGELALNTFDGRAYMLRNNGTASVVQINPVIQVLSAEWQTVAGLSPVEDYEFDEKDYLFTQGAGQALAIYLRVPSTYLTGSQIKMRGSFYTPGTTNNIKMLATATLIRRNTDAVTSVVNQYASTNGDQALTVAFQYMETIFDLTTTTGLINAIAVNPGDLLKVQLTRVSPTGTEDANDVRFLPSTTEVLYS